MFATIGRSFRLVKLCLHVLAVDKELILFPLFSSIGVVLVMLTFMGVGLGIGALDRINAGAVGGGDLVVAFTFYVFSYFVIIFFNSALVYAAHERLAGGGPKYTLRPERGNAIYSDDIHVGGPRRDRRIDTEHPVQPGAAAWRHHGHDQPYHHFHAGRRVDAYHLLYCAADSH